MVKGDDVLYSVGGATGKTFQRRDCRPPLPYNKHPAAAIYAGYPTTVLRLAADEATSTIESPND